MELSCYPWRGYVIHGVLAGAWEQEENQDYGGGCGCVANVAPTPRVGASDKTC